MKKGNWSSDGLVKWLLAQMKERNESARDMSLKCDLDHGAISRYLLGTRPSPANCVKMADGLGIPRRRIMYLAGYEDAPPDHSDFLREVGHLTEGWTPEQKQALLDSIRIAHRVREAR